MVAQQAAEIVAALPPLVTAVGLFVNAGREEIASVLDAVALDVLQFHGDESADFCRQFQRPYLKALRMRPDIDLTAACDAYSDARAVLVDSWKPGVPGGTGETFDWQRAAVSLTRPLIVAGGLHAGNVAQAIAQLAPAAVDVSGGVEAEPGRKCPHKVRDFIAAVHAA